MTKQQVQRIQLLGAVKHMSEAKLDKELTFARSVAYDPPSCKWLKLLQAEVGRRTAVAA